SSCCGAHRYLHTLPTRRSSDLLLDPEQIADLADHPAVLRRIGHLDRLMTPLEPEPADALDVRGLAAVFALQQREPQLLAVRHRRSEEHTSELQSRENLVCRLLL